jgi:hypothetical protein
MASTTTTNELAALLNADGSASDPAAFQNALRADASKMAALDADPELRDVVLGNDVAALQALLRQAHLVRARARARS